jgi:hypothetical protein
MSEDGAENYSVRVSNTAKVTEPERFTGAIEVLDPVLPDAKPNVTPPEKPLIINVNPNTGEMTGIMPPEQVERLNEPYWAATEQAELEEQREEAIRRGYQEALERKRLEDLVTNKGIEKGKELSQLVNTLEGRKELEKVLDGIVAANKGFFGNEQKIKDGLIEEIDNDKFSGSNLKYIFFKAWQSKNKNNQNFIRDNNVFQSQTQGTINNLMEVRQFILDNKININYSDVKFSDMEKIKKDQTLRDMYLQGFKNSWNEVKNSNNLAKEPVPWYLRENKKDKNAKDGKL